MGRKKVISSQEVGSADLVADLVTALQPFADMSIAEDEWFTNTVICSRGDFSITFGDLHRARVALGKMRTP